MDEAKVKEEMGIKEIKEFIEAMLETGIIVTKLLKDGAQYADAIAFLNALMTNEAYKAKIQAAYEGADKIPAEIRDVSWAEGAELIMIGALYVPKFIEALKKQDA